MQAMKSQRNRFICIKICMFNLFPNMRSFKGSKSYLPTMKVANAAEYNTVSLDLRSEASLLPK